MFGLWRAHRARRAAKSAILPLVEGTRIRCGAIPEVAWLDAYIMGFLATLITLFGTQKSGPLHADALAALQSGAWADITNMPGDLAGEQICYLSVAKDATFLQGCRNAEIFFQSLFTAQAGLAPPAVQNESPDERPASGDELALWTHYFESHLEAETYG